MFLVRLVYASQISSQFKPEAIEKILDTARRENARNELSGVLYFNREYFLQCLEGSRTAVNETYHRIAQDERHKNLTLLDYTAISEREFASWTMAFLPDLKEVSPLVKKFSSSASFDPYKMSGPSCMQLLAALQTSTLH